MHHGSALFVNMLLDMFRQHVGPGTRLRYSTTSHEAVIQLILKIGSIINFRPNIMSLVVGCGSG